MAHQSLQVISKLTLKLLSCLGLTEYLYIVSMIVVPMCTLLMEKVMCNQQVLNPITAQVLTFKLNNHV